MARYLGIDFGSKKTGLALSDEDGKMAFPLYVLETTKNLTQEVSDIIEEKKVSAVVLGDSQDFEGKDNPIMKLVNIFRKNLEKDAKVTVYLEPEVFSTKEAARIQGYTPSLDASAASIILQSFLDKQNNGHT